MNRAAALLLPAALCCLLVAADAERTKVKMYQAINGTAACFRRLNATHQTGCTSARSGSTGIIHMIRNETDIQFVLHDGVASPYVAVVSLDVISKDVLARFKNEHERIAGVVVYKPSRRPDYYSNEARCPNEGYGYKEAVCNDANAWNPHGTGILYEDYPFPIFLLQDEDSLNKIRECFSKFNNYDSGNQHMRSLCALELSSFMSAAVNSETCLRRSKSWINFTQMRYCDPLGDKNVWATLFPFVNKTRKVVLLTARMDTATLYDGVTPGAVSPVTGLVTLMITSHLLRTIVDEISLSHEDASNVFFVLFNGESYGYIGSSRFIYDLENDMFPMKPDAEIENPVPNLKLEDIDFVVDLGQLANSDVLYTHSLDGSERASKFANILGKYAKSYFKVKPASRIPPTSLQSFLAETKPVQGLVLTDHGDNEFKNHYFNSIYDDSDNVAYSYRNITESEADADGSIQSFVANVSLALAQSLLETITDGKKTFTGDLDHKRRRAFLLADELLHCYLDSTDCKMNQATTLQRNFEKKPQPLYVGVYRSSNTVTVFTGLALAWLTGTINDTLNEKNCTADYHNPVYQYFWMSSELDNISAVVCYQTTMNFSQALSPAFETDEYDWESGKYSTWTESVWPDLTVRMFLKPSLRHEIITLSIGTITLVLSIATVYFIKTKSDILFPKPDSSNTGVNC